MLHRWIAQDAIYSAASVPQQEIGAAAIQAAQAWVLSPSEKNRKAAANAVEDSQAADIAYYEANAVAYATTPSGSANAAAHYTAATAATGNSGANVAYAAYYACYAATADDIDSGLAEKAAKQRMLLLQMLSDADILPEPTAAAIQNRGSRGLYRL